MTEQYLRLLEAAVADPDQRLWELRMLSPADEQMLAAFGGDT